MLCLLQQQGPQWACLGLESWLAGACAPEGSAQGHRALALALLCSSVVFLKQVVSGKLMWLFEVDHYISWKSQQAMERLLVAVGETLFCLREGRFIKPTTQGVQGRNPASLLAGNQAWGTRSPWIPFCQAAQEWGCGTVGILVLPSSSPASGSCSLSPPLLLLPSPFHPWLIIEPCHPAQFWGPWLYWAEGSWSFPSSLGRDPPEGFTGGSCPAAAPL